MKHTPASAKQFLSSKLSAQAAHDKVTLDEIEKRMFVFSESSVTADIEAMEVFDKNYDSGDYESKVTRLLRKAYAHDKRKKEGKREWSDALKTLSQEDFYGLVMIDQAGIPRSDEGLWQFELEWLPFEVIELAVIVLGFLLVFRPSALGLSLPDWARWLAYPLFLWLFWYIGRVWSRMWDARAVKQSKRPGR
jgi:hypothetical protein